MLGSVDRQPSQSLVTVDGRRVLVEPDPVGRSISMCPNYGITVKPCTTTVGVVAGYAMALRIDKQAIALETVHGPTDGVPPGVAEHLVFDPGQSLVGTDA